MNVATSVMGSVATFDFVYLYTCCISVGGKLTDVGLLYSIFVFPVQSLRNSRKCKKCCNQPFWLY